MLSLLRAWVQSLVGELKSHKLHGTAKKKKKKIMLIWGNWGHADEVWMGTENLPHHPLAPPLPSFLGLHFSGRALHYPSPLLSAPNLTWPMNIHLS